MAAHRDLLGEGPWWSVREQRLYWVDILGRTVHRAALDGSAHETWETPSKVGFVVARAEGGVLVGLRDGVYELDLDTGSVERVAPVEADRSETRLNDGKCDRAGRLWFGSMHDLEQERLGSLYRYDRQHGVRKVLDGIHTSNGLGWSPDGSAMYYTDSAARTIWVLDVDPVSGDISHRRDFAQDPPAYVPDGLTVDADGFVWSAKWDGAKVVRYAPDGSVEREVPMPVRRPTSCVFAGPDLGTLVVTSASLSVSAQEDPDSLAGAIFLLEADGVRGLPEAPFAG